MYSKFYSMLYIIPYYFLYSILNSIPYSIVYSTVYSVLYSILYFIPSFIISIFYSRLYSIFYYLFYSKFYSIFCFIFYFKFYFMLYSLWLSSLLLLWSWTWSWPRCHGHTFKTRHGRASEVEWLCRYNVWPFLARLIIHLAIHATRNRKNPHIYATELHMSICLNFLHFLQTSLLIWVSPGPCSLYPRHLEVAAGDAGCYIKWKKIVVSDF